MTVRSSQHQQREPLPAKAEKTPGAQSKKTFVEPAVSSPVDVLEATTYFQVVESGGTGDPVTGGRGGTGS
jgi:hypothetical protein